MSSVQDAPALLLRWYDAHKRTMPWRGCGDPYAIWISETMLQQTRVETVIPYYQRFLAELPTIAALADAPEERVLKLWEGLGYYSRARNLHRGAQQIMAEYGGQLPADIALLRKISGIGPYTAGAIASIAFGLPEPAVDGNVIRVISRLCDLRENMQIPSVKRELTETVRGLIPTDRPGDFNQALMDLGATICVPDTPNCETCPLRMVCLGLEAGEPEMLPTLPDKRPPKVIPYDLLILRDAQGRVLLRPRSEKLLEGLWCFPLLESEDSSAAEVAAAASKALHIPCRDAEHVGDAKHVFTHRVWQMRLWMLHTDAPAPADWRFCTADEVRALPMPTAVKAARGIVLQGNLKKEEKL